MSRRRTSRETAHEPRISVHDRLAGPARPWRATRTGTRSPNSWAVLRTRARLRARRGPSPMARAASIKAGLAASSASWEAPSAGVGAGSLLGGGLNELVERFTQNGHGETASSWINQGPEPRKSRRRTSKRPSARTSWPPLAQQTGADTARNCCPACRGNCRRPSTATPPTAAFRPEASSPPGRAPPGRIDKGQSSVPRRISIATEK